ncbi:MAG: protein kinase, partial [Planctomycetaceae bacterium]|nr:protein kinase [Planctomycetaceae bacterium]
MNHSTPTTTCPDESALQQMLDAADDAPTKSPLMAVRRHVDTCASCQQRLEQMLLAQEQPIRNTVHANPSTLNAADWMQKILRSVVDQSQTAQRGTATGREIQTDDGGNRNQEEAFWPQLPGCELVRHIASGATGHLFLARDLRLNRQVAVKVLRRELMTHPSARHRLMQEANAIARIQSDGIVATHDIIDRTDMPPCLVMEYVDGPSLQEALDAGFRPSFRASAELLVQALSALSASH